MAKIVSPVWSSIRGSIAGTTYLTRADGAIVGRQRNKPVNKRSNRQNGIRNSMVAGAFVWTNLSDSVRAAWDSYATITGYTNGRQAFLAGYTLANYLAGPVGAGNTIGTGAPIISHTISMTPLLTDILVGPGTGINLNIQNLETEAIMALVDVSPPFSVTRNFWTGPWDRTKQISISVAASTLESTEILDLVEGAKYFVRVRAVIDGDPCRISPLSILNGIATTLP